MNWAVKSSIFCLESIHRIRRSELCSDQNVKAYCNRCGISCDDDISLSPIALSKAVAKEDGMPLSHNIGRCLESFGIKVLRRFDCDFEDITQALAQGNNLMAVVDGGELNGNETTEYFEDVFEGGKPDHVVVVLDCNMSEGTITIFDPDSASPQDRYTLARFADAWADSKNYLIITSIKDMETYNPKPTDLTGVGITRRVGRIERSHGRACSRSMGSKPQSRRLELRTATQ